jgi:hypothetical protein
LRPSETALSLAVKDLPWKLGLLEIEWVVDRETAHREPVYLDVTGLPTGRSAAVARLGPAGAWQIFRVDGGRIDWWRGCYSSPEAALDALQRGWAEE